MKTRIARHLAIYALIALTGYGIGACRQNVMLNPSEDDLVVLNGCVSYVDHPAGHAYCVWETEGTIYGYDRNAGGFPIPVYTHDAKSIAIILAEQ